MMSKQSSYTYGLLARFRDSEALVAAARKVSQEGYQVVDAYTPYPVEGLADAMRLPGSPLPYAVFAGGLIGGLGGYLMQYYATVINLPWNIGGRPLNSWLTYIPITFELTVLLAAFGGIIGLFVVTRFPQPYHPVFNVEDFRKHGSQDGFYLSIASSDRRFDEAETRKFLEDLGAILVAEIEA